MPIRLLPALLLALAACPLAVAASAVPRPQNPGEEPELGQLGFQPPEVADIRLPDQLLHQDTSGGVAQQLLGLSGARGGGFAAVWRDQRDGMLGLYFARLGPDAHRLEPERPLYAEPGTARRLDPTVAIDADGSGAVAWISMIDGTLRPWIRCFDAEGRFGGDNMPVAEPASGPGRARAANDERASGARTPIVLTRPTGGRTLVWLGGGRVRRVDMDAGGNPTRAAYEVGPAGTEPEPGLCAVFDAEGRLGVAWAGKGGARVTVRGETDLGSAELGEGRPRSICADPAGGFWVLIQRGESVLLRHVSAQGRADGPELNLVQGPLRSADLAPRPGGYALAVVRGEPSAPPARDPGRKRGQSGRNDVRAPGGEGAGAESSGIQRGGQRGDAPRGPVAAAGGRVELWLLGAGGALSAPQPIAVSSEQAVDAADARIASSGSKLLVAWTDARAGDADIFARTFDPGAEGDARLGPESRINSDEASTDQIRPDVDAARGRGVAVWQDRRAGRSRVFARRFDANGLSGDEIALPTGVPAAEMPGKDVACGGAVVAVRDDGSALAVWSEEEGAEARIVAQILDAQGRAGSKRIEIDARGTSGTGEPAVCALHGARGWIVAWSRGPAEGLWARRVAPDGAQTTPRRISDPGDDARTDVDVATLEDGRVLAAWTEHRAGAKAEEGWRLRARFLDPDGAARGSELAFESSRRGQDWDPAIAPARGGGFLLAWCSGYPSEPTRDVNVRLFDSGGRAAGPNLTPCVLGNEQDFPDVARLADGSFAVAWEDDISYYDHVYVRRVAADGRSLGPWMRINSLETTIVPDRVTPRICALGDGFAAVFSDRRRSRGLDTRIKIVGPRFDPPGGG